MADVTKCDVESEVEKFEYSQDGKDIRCVNCALMKLKLHSVSQEVKSLQGVIDILQDEVNGLRKELYLNPMADREHKEGLLTSDQGKDWSKIVKKKTKTYSYKETSYIPEVHAPTTTKMSNLFEILHNLNDDDITEEPKGSMLQPDIYNSEEKNQQTALPKLTKGIPTIINGVISANHNNFIGHKLTKDSQQKFDHKIVIIGDSHARGCANNVKSNLSDNFRTEGIVKPGAVMSTLMTSGTGVIKESTNKDIIVLWGGANDISSNNTSEGLNISQIL